MDPPQHCTWVRRVCPPWHWGTCWQVTRGVDTRMTTVARSWSRGHVDVAESDTTVETVKAETCAPATTWGHNHTQLLAEDWFSLLMLMNGRDCLYLCKLRECKSEIELEHKQSFVWPYFPSISAVWRSGDKTPSIVLERKTICVESKILCCSSGIALTLLGIVAYLFELIDILFKLVMKSKECWVCLLPESLCFAVTRPRIAGQRQLMDDRKHILDLLHPSKMVVSQVESLQLAEASKGARLHAVDLTVAEVSLDQVGDKFERELWHSFDWVILQDQCLKIGNGVKGSWRNAV